MRLMLSNEGRALFSIGGAPPGLKGKCRDPTLRSGLLSRIIVQDTDKPPTPKERAPVDRRERLFR